MNLIEMFKDQAGAALISKASSFLGADAAKTSAGLGAAIPSILGGLIDKGSSESGAGEIMDMLKGGNFDGSMLDNIGSVFGDASSANQLMNSGGGILQSLLGDKLSGITDIISRVSGLKTGNSSSLLKMAAPMLMSLVGKKVLGGNMGVSGLMDLLKGQREHVEKAAPAGLGALLGLGKLGDMGKAGLSKATGAVSGATAAAGNTVRNVGGAARNAGGAAATTVGNTAKKGGGLLGKLLPLLLLILLAIFAFFMYRGCQDGQSLGDSIKGAADQTVSSTTGAMKDGANAVKDGANAAGNAIKDGANAAGDAIKDGANAVGDAFRKIEMPGGEEISAAAGGFTDRMARAFSGKGSTDEAFVFDGVNFATGSANITDDSDVQITNLAKLMKAYADVKIRVEGHTDNTGNAQNNLDLSKARAAAVKSALEAKGVAADRVDAVGRGQASPTATNDTEEGRLANRRVEVYITEK